jgi:hypothetical protein
LSPGYFAPEAPVCASALAKERRAEFVTGDPEFKALEGEWEIRWLT